ncbi:MAG TPA: lipocalin family protein [Bacteroidales bacterium]|nr:lipocalin family protein [Bacteroidales bacterium]
MKIRSILIFILVVNLFTGYTQQLPTIDRMDLNLFAGLWYEVALYPVDSRNDCHCTTVEYEYIPGNRFFKSTTRCIQFHKGRPEMTVSHSKVISVSDANESKMKFQTTGPVRVTYEIIALTADYNLAVIVNREKKNLSILSRDSFVPSFKYNEILKLIKDKGFNTSGIVKTPQNCDNIE